MTPHYILRKSLCRPAHCFSAHVIGQGYVNRGEVQATRADYDRQRVQRTESEIDNLGWAPGYAEPGYDQPTRGVLLADWNVFPTGIDTILERAGYTIEWSDEWITCAECNKAVRTEPDGYDWTPSYVIVDGDFLCRSCADEA
jgi:hypothetical protein